jgi:hypothetical protein
VPYGLLSPWEGKNMWYDAKNWRMRAMACAYRTARWLEKTAGHPTMISKAMQRSYELLFAHGQIVHGVMAQDDLGWAYLDECLPQGMNLAALLQNRGYAKAIRPALINYVGESHMARLFLRNPHDLLRKGISPEKARAQLHEFAVQAAADITAVLSPDQH